MTTTSLAAGQRIGRYELVRQLGQGGMGVVWEAMLHGPEGFRRAVALKVLHAREDAAGARAALTREARLGALLSHPNVVATYEVGEADGTWFLAMELVRGPTVAELARRADLSPAAVVEVGVQACSGLAHIHELDVDGAAAGLVHRDIKTANLLLDRSGLLKIADLGVARLSDRREEAAGTAGYAAPEQIEGKEDARADVFSLGVVLYRLATGKLPFGKGKRALAAVFDADACFEEEGLEEVVEARIPGLGPILRRCLRTSAEERWPSASALGRALRGLRVEAGTSLAELAMGAPAVPRPVEAQAGPSRPPAAVTGMFAVGNLPRSSDRFVGREAELAGLVDLLAPSALVSVVGLGGMGKTRITLEAARQLADLPGGSWYVDLSAATDEGALVSAVAGVLGVAASREADPVGAVGRALRARGRALLLLDNLEQVVEAAAAPIARWSELAPEATLLCTSRIALSLPNEVLLPLAPLEQRDAERLFGLRLGRPPTADESPAIPRLVAALEGYPLAIELAAARARLLPVGTVLSRLDERFRLLAGGGRERPERHRSLRASLDGSFELLEPAQREAMAQLSVFEDPFTFEAAEAVLRVSDEGAWALDLVEALVRHSLLRLDRAQGRFRMLQLVRDYAAERLDDAARAAVRRRHAAWFSQLGSDEHLEALQGPEGPARLRGLQADQRDLVAAFRSALELGRLDQAATALRATWTILQGHGPATDAERMARDALRTLKLTPSDRARTFIVLAEAIEHQTRLPEARETFERALGAALDAGSAIEEGRALGGLARLTHQMGDASTAQPLYRRAIDAFQRAGLPRFAARMGANLGTLLAKLGDVDAGRPLVEAGRESARASGDARAMVVSELQLAHVLGLVGDVSGELEQTRHALTLARQLGDLRIEGKVLGNLGMIYTKLGRQEDALRAYAAARPLQAEVGDRHAEGNLLLNLGLLLEQRGEAEEALRLGEEALALFRELGVGDAVGSVLVNLASACRGVGRRDEAERYAQEGAATGRARGHRRTEARANALLGQLAMDRGDLEEAVRLLHDALAMHRETRNLRSEGMTLGWLGDVYERLGDFVAAEQHHREAVERHRATANVRSERRSLRALAALAGARGDAVAASGYADQAAALAEPGDEPATQPMSAGAAGMAKLGGEPPSR